MPLISEIKKNKINKSFKKKDYRPWDDSPNTKLVCDEDIISHSNNFIKSTNNNSDPDLVNFKEDILKKELRKMFGAQKIIMKYLMNNIEERDDKFAITKSVTMEEFSSQCQIPSSTIKSTLSKLKNKKLFVTYENKPGRGGYARYKFLLSTFSFFSDSLLKEHK